MNILENIKVVNIGLEFFYEELVKQNCEAINMQWTPPPQISNKALDFLKKLKEDV